MPWQTPKTDWQTPNGVRNTDFNRIEGNIQELYNTGKVNQATTVYVRATGSDVTGNGSLSAPYASITKALSTIPCNLSGYTVTINVGAGTYGEGVVISGYSNGKIIIGGTYNQEVEVRSITVRSATCEITQIRLYASAASGTAVSVLDNGTLLCSSNISITGTGLLRGVYVAGGSTCRISGQINVSNTTTAAIHATNASRCYVYMLSGSNNVVAMLAEEGSIIGYSSTNITVTAAGYVTRTGGRVYTGGQTSLPNY